MALTNEEIFDLAMKHFGETGRFDPSTAGPQTVGIFELRTRSARGQIDNARTVVPSLPPIHFDFSFFPKLSALAFEREDRCFISYSAGTEFTLMFVFNHLLADRRVFPKIGNPDAELAWIDPIKNLAADSEKMHGAGNKMLRPRDMTRNEFAQHLRHLAAIFIVAHEIAHHVEGHITYAFDHLKLSYLSSSGIPTTDAQKDLYWQTLEMWADCRAAWNGMSSMHAHFRDAPQSPARFCETPLGSLYNWLFAIFVLCRLHGDPLLSECDLADGTHPPWRMRQLLIMGMVGSYIAQEDRSGVFGSQADISTLLGRCLTDCEKAIALATNTQFKSENIMSWNCQAVLDHKNRLLEIWKSGLRDKLQPLSHVTLPD